MSIRDDLLNAARRANEVLEEFEVRKRIEQGYTRIDPVRIAESADVPVMFQPLQKLLGAYLNVGRPGIMVNINRGSGLIHMTCAHELGHYFLDHQPHADITVEYGENADIVERQADQFAFSLLVPRWLLKVIMTRKGWKSLAEPVVLYQLSLRLGTSYTSTVWTLHRMKIFNSLVANELARIPPKTIKARITGGEVPDDRGDVWLLDQHDRDYILEPHKTDHFVFDLPSKAGSGYVWSLDDVVAKGYAVEPLQNDVRKTSVEKHFGPNPEFGPNHSRKFVAVPVGGAEDERVDPGSFSMYQRRPWEKDVLEGLDNQCTFNTQFELVSNGLDQRERMRRIEEVKATA